MAEYKILDIWQVFYAIVFGIILIIEIIGLPLLSSVVSMAIQEINASPFLSAQSLQSLIVVFVIFTYPIFYFISLFVPAHLRKQNKPRIALLVMILPAFSLFLFWGLGHSCK